VVLPGVAGPRRLAALGLTALAFAVAAEPPANAAAATTASAASKRLVAISPATKLGYLEYARMQIGGVKTLRVPFFWEDLQPGRSRFDWRTADEAAIYAAATGIRLRPFVMGVPPWLQRASRTSQYPPVSSSVFKRSWSKLMRKLIERYGPGGEVWRYLREVAPRIKPRPIRSWQIWNEPNARTYWRPGTTAPEGYAELLKLSARVIRANDPGAKVIAAGLFLTPLDGVPMPRFVRELYEVPGVAASIDALALHPYAPDKDGVLDQIRIARELMARNGDASAQLWITELGWPTERSFGRGIFVKSEPVQARLLTRTFRAILAHRRSWRIGSLTWYTWRDNDLFPNCDLCRFSGLFRRDLSAKPSWRSFVRFTGGTARVPRRSVLPPRPPLPPRSPLP
jgi:hypothetical protein